MKDDPIEAAFVALCDRYKIRYVRPEQHGGRLDFHLPDVGLYVEVKAHSTPRLHDQLESVAGRPIMVLVSIEAVDCLELLISRKYKHYGVTHG